MPHQGVELKGTWLYFNEINIKMQSNDKFLFQFSVINVFGVVLSILLSRQLENNYFILQWQGSVLYNYIKHGKLERSEGSSIAEGIGQGRVTANLKDAPIDDAHTILDTDAVKMVVYAYYYYVRILCNSNLLSYDHQEQGGR